MLRFQNLIHRFVNDVHRAANEHQAVDQGSEQGETVVSEGVLLGAPLFRLAVQVPGKPEGDAVAQVVQGVGRMATLLSQQPTHEFQNSKAQIEEKGNREVFGRSDGGDRVAYRCFIENWHKDKGNDHAVFSGSYSGADERRGTRKCKSIGSLRQEMSWCIVRLIVSS